MFQGELNKVKGVLTQMGYNFNPNYKILNATLRSAYYITVDSQRYETRKVNGTNVINYIGYADEHQMLRELPNITDSPEAEEVAVEAQRKDEFITSEEWQCETAKSRIEYLRNHLKENALQIAASEISGIAHELINLEEIVKIHS